ncbi:MAG: hypothetical protein AAGC60_01425 [Acidobacteriota bacterium]
MNQLFRFVHLRRLPPADRPTPADPQGPEVDLPKLSDFAESLRGTWAARGLEAARGQAGEALPELLEAAEAPKAEALGRLAEWARRQRPPATRLREQVTRRLGDLAGSDLDHLETALVDAALVLSLAAGSNSDARASRTVLDQRLRGLRLARLVLDEEVDESLLSADPLSTDRIATVLATPVQLPSIEPVASSAARPETTGSTGSESVLTAPPAATDARPALRTARREIERLRPPRGTGRSSSEGLDGDTRSQVSQPTRRVVETLGLDLEQPVPRLLDRIDHALSDAGREAVAGTPRQVRRMVPYNGGLLELQSVPELQTPGPDGDGVPQRFGTARVLGIGELVVVREELARYEAREISHIENVLASETRGRTHTAKTDVEETVTTLEETIDEFSHELGSNERFSSRRRPPSRPRLSNRCRSACRYRAASAR